jgi:hypothetical protein
LGEKGGDLKEMRKLLCTISCCLFLIPGCSRAQKQVVMVEPLQVEEFSAAIENIHPLNTKKVFDYVRIDGEKYPVPVPWRGKELKVKPLESSALKQIPLEFSRDGSKLYLLESACEAFVRMAEKAKDDNVILVVHSGYRSIWYQRKIFRQLMAAGRTWDDLVRYVAPPGYSEHMLGRVVDLYPSNWSFASTSEYEWLKKHASAYGFTETYPESAKDGFPWEPWHWKFTDPGEK